jgi:hypothetical protein
MQQVKGVRAVVQGDLPDEIMERIAASVRRAVLHELADVDLGPRLFQIPLQPAPQPAPAPGSGEDVGVGEFDPSVFVPFVLGIWFQPGEEPLLPDIQGPVDV